ncbi:MAG: hypothetical protein COC06_05380 [Bacteroidales bacterium]|nr:MAG: hypothetical protein COC06_05380 [Bacteroidales bacterium]
MKNPIQVFDKIKDNFILYVETAFHTRYEGFEEDRRNLLKQDKIFARSPWVEPLPIYQPSEFKINEIPFIDNLNEDELKIFKDIVSKGLVGDFRIYQHQYEMLIKAMKGNHCVITSGTGSGKTEAFLLPLFAYLSKELNKWKHTGNTLNNTKWWSEKGWGPAKIVGKGNTSLTESVRQRPYLQRPAAIRAMLIYPMNALVEDQLSRLRKALDSDKLRDVLESDYDNNRIYFGRYNSTSPVSGKIYKNNENGEINPNKYKVQQLKKELCLIEDNISQLNEYIVQNPDNLDADKIADLKSNFQQLDGAEMRTRFDMQETPPDIMITNFSMLSIMLMRTIENSIFDKTKAWLNCTTEFDAELSSEEIEQEKKERVFHLVIDELHLYRGGSGSETAYLIRMLLDRIGLTPDSDQLRILASSASLEGEEGKAFLKSFFGTEKKEIEIIEGTELKPEGKDVSPLVDLVNEFAVIGQKSDILEKELPESIDNKEEIDAKIGLHIPNYTNNLIDVLTCDSKVENSGTTVFNFKVQESLFFAFNIDGRIRAVPAFKNGFADDSKGVKFISEALFGEREKENKDAVKGFFYLLGLLEKYKIKHDYPRIRFHLFYRNIAGMWGELIPDDEIEVKGVPVGELLTVPKISHNNHRTLELLYCENCGTLAYGGSRVQYKDENDDPYTELIPVSPDIEGVPETSPSTIVEKRKYKDFSVFCPGKYNVLDSEHKIKNSDFKYKWYKAWLNVNSGKIIPENQDCSNTPEALANYITGYWLRVLNSNGKDIADIEDSKLAKEISSLPHNCPHCEADYSHPMKKKQSPFRGFRTGFGKVNQILAKELFEALPEGEETKKLVAFSDSREDAAKLAKSIEEEHYNSLLKEVVIHNITDVLQLENNIIEALESGNDKLLNEYIEKNELVCQDIIQLWENINGRLPKPENQIKYNAIKENIKTVSDFVQIVIKELLRFGINPGGTYKSLENFKVGKEYIQWHNFFNFDELDYDKTKDGWENVKDRLNVRIEQNISSFIFGRLYYSFEASGLGYATLNKNHFLSNKANNLGVTTDFIHQVCNSFMRIWGDNYKHNRTEYNVNLYISYESLPNSRKEKRYVREICKQKGLNEIALGNIIFEVLQNNGHRGIIEINNLIVKVANKTTSYYRCQHCGTIHLQLSGGVCVFCLKSLNQQEVGTVEELWNKNYLTASLNQEYKPFRLHTEELTGQTDNQLLRQRQFKNIFLNPKDKLIQKIDLLSVTTTLEVGVDIGALQAILLANMPPQRFNYQQRVGRTGRRGQLYSYALTFARGRSHDEYYFDNPLSITGDKPPQPFLSLDQERIFKRILAKAILRYAFRKLQISEGSVHGEFGDVNSFNKNELKTIIEDKIENEIKDIFDSINVGIYSNGKLKPFSFECFTDWIIGLPEEIQGIIDSQNIDNGDLSELLAESGILPMAGMPTRIRNLIHGFKRIKGEDKGYEPLSIDRDLGMAIYEFAPGSQKTKDKGVYQAIGFTPNISGISKNYANQGKMEVDAMHRDAFTERKWLVQDSFTKVIKSEPYNEISKVDDEQRLVEDNPDCTVFVGASPAAFRTDLKFPKDSNEDFDINISKPLTFAETKDDIIPKDIGNCRIKYAQQELTWKINSNGGDLFKGKYIKQDKYGASFEHQWINSDFINQLDNIQVISTEAESISLASSKITEVFRIEPNQLDLSLDINPFENSDLFKASASKGAFYSAAFLLQRTLADDLDIDPEEIEIAAIDSIVLPEIGGVLNRNSASIVLADELPNGSGFIQQLYNNFEKYLKKCIAPHSVKDKYNYSIIANQECNDASYNDLKNYRNMNFHPLLDWKLGVGLLRIMSDKKYLSGLIEDDFKYPELSNWQDFTKELAKKVEIDFDNVKCETYGSLNGFTITDEIKVIIVHPFWNWTSHQPNEEQNILTKAIAEAGTENLFFVDSFNLHRRPGWCYGKIIKKVLND